MPYNNITGHTLLWPDRQTVVLDSRRHSDAQSCVERQKNMSHMTSMASHMILIFIFIVTVILHTNGRKTK
jgi:hypothetical protein